MSEEAWLIVGLGNPGPKYAKTRHNVGFQVLDELARRAQVTLSTKRFDGTFGSGRVGSSRALFLAPTTFMNRSGLAVAQARKFYDIPLDRVRIVHDEVDLDLGVVRLKSGGGNGGHNGLKSISERLGSRDYARLRVGIGRPPGKPGGDLSPHVLGTFKAAESDDLLKAVDLAADAAEAALAQGVLEAMNEVNRRR